jgi:hypothetical protein
MSEAHSDALVFFGATGDLAYKKIFPSLQAMVKRGTLTVPVIGVARPDWTLDQFRADPRREGQGLEGDRAARRDRRRSREVSRLPIGERRGVRFADRDVHGAAARDRFLALAGEPSFTSAPGRVCRSPAQSW